MLSLTSCLLMGCATFYDQKEFDAGKAAKLSSPTCVKLTFWRNEYDFSHEITKNERYLDYHANQLEQYLRAFNIRTDCSDPVASYDVVVGIRNKYVVLKTFWGVVSMASLGIIPFFGDDTNNIIVEKDRKVVGDVWVSNKRVFSIFLIGKMYSDDKISFETYGSDMANALFNIKIAEIIKKDLEPKPSVVMGGR
ncbi:hypothetical protein [Bdellovibrio sp. HCB-162]|uniref:hypothetical protein n=1 Tax=Bdellovibrio sp. HCB-162 TaxID=3394234 RepID=UPI0039BD6ECC